MKNIKRNILAIFLTAMLLFSPLASFATGVYALSGYNGETDTIYYFSDSYPSIRKEKMEEQYPNHNIIYDHQWINEAMLSDMVSSGYFCTLDSDSILIIDIKSFLPNANILYTLFRDIKIYTACQIIFVTPYELMDFSNTAFSDYLDIFFTTNLDRLYSFLINSIKDMYLNQSLLNTVILLDRRMIELGNSTQYSLSDLANNSFFLQFLLNSIFSELETDSLDYIFPPFDSQNYDTVEDILEIYGIQLIVHNGGDDYVNIVTDTTYQCDEFNEITSAIENPDYNSMCAIGFWYLETELHDLLVEGRLTTDITTYTFVIDPLIISEDGLPIITDEQLEQWYGGSNCEENDLLNLLDELI